MQTQKSILGCDPCHTEYSYELVNKDLILAEVAVFLKAQILPKIRQHMKRQGTKAQ